MVQLTRSQHVSLARRLVQLTCQCKLHSPTASYNSPVTACFTRPPLGTTHLSQHASLAHRLVQLPCHSTLHSPTDCTTHQSQYFTRPPLVLSPTASYNSPVTAGFTRPPLGIPLSQHASLARFTSLAHRFSTTRTSPVTARFTRPPLCTTHLSQHASLAHRFLQLTCHSRLYSPSAWYISHLTARFTSPPLGTTHLSQHASLAHRLVQLPSHNTLHSPTDSYNSPVTARFTRPPLRTTHLSQHASLCPSLCRTHLSQQA